jgi:glucosamine--fructose-6-phosphate aminotransferase (isomerizing)
VLEQAAEADWSAAVPLLLNAEEMLVLGRGPTLTIAGEAALKLKETSSLMPKPSAAPRSPMAR